MSWLPSYIHALASLVWEDVSKRWALFIRDTDTYIYVVPHLGSI